MKKLFAIFALLLFAGCSNNPKGNPKLKPGEWSEKDSCVIHVETEKEVSYGMSMEEVEEILGTNIGISKKDIITYEKHMYADDLFIWYKDNNVAQFILDSDSYSTYRNITIGSTKDDIISKYGETELISTVGSSLFIEYIYSEDGKGFIQKENVSKDTLSPDDSYISFILNPDDETVERIIITAVKYNFFFK